MYATCAAPGPRAAATSTRHARRQRPRTPRQNSAARPPECRVCLGSTAPPAAAEVLPIQHAWRLHATLPSPGRASAAAAACVQSPRPVIRPRCQCNVAGRLLAVPCRPEQVLAAESCPATKAQRQGSSMQCAWRLRPALPASWRPSAARAALGGRGLAWPDRLPRAPRAVADLDAVGLPQTPCRQTLGVRQHRMHSHNTTAKASCLCYVLS